MNMGIYLLVLGLFVSSVLNESVFAQSAPKPKPKPKTVTSTQSPKVNTPVEATKTEAKSAETHTVTPATSPILEKAIRDARATIAKIELESSTQPPQSKADVERALALDIAHKNAQWVLDHEQELREIYKAFLTGTSPLPNSADRVQDWIKVQGEVALEPKNVCKPDESGCVVKIPLVTLIEYFKALEDYAKQYKGDPSYLEQLMASPRITKHKLTPKQGIAALEVWKAQQSTLYPNCPNLNWNEETHQFKIEWSNEVSVRVFLNSPFVKSSLQDAKDPKILFEQRVNLLDMGAENTVQNQDQLIWALIRYSNVTIDDVPISGEDRLNENLALQNDERLCPGLVKTSGPLSTFDYQKSQIMSQDQLKNCPDFLNRHDSNGQGSSFGASKKNKFGMTFVSIPAGTFTMGSGQPDGQGKATSTLNASDNEKNAHIVKLTRGFLMQETEVSQKQYEAVMGMGTNPSNRKGENLPVEQISWENVQKFINKLNELENPRSNCGDVATVDGFEKARKTYGCYRLPTEAEWEYAARAGTMTAFSFGDSESDLANHGWYYENSGSRTHAVTECPIQNQSSDKKTDCRNKFKLYHMHGNVWEWAQDSWEGSSGYEKSEATDPLSKSGTSRSLRGGGWGSNARYARSAYRGGGDPSAGNGAVGFRLVRTQ